MMLGGISLAMTQPRGAGAAAPAPSYDAMTTAYLAAMAVQPTATQAGWYDELIAGLRSDGDLTGLTHLYLFVGENTADAGLINVIAPGTNNITKLGTGTFVDNAGWTGNAVDGLLDTGYAISAFQNDIMLAVYSTLDGVFGSAIGNSNSFITPRNGSDAMSVRLNDGTSRTSANGTQTNGKGLHVARRNASGVADAYKAWSRGTQMIAGSGSSQTPSAQTVCIGGRYTTGATAFDGRTQGAAFIGRGVGVDTTEVARITARFDTYMAHFGISPT